MSWKEDPELVRPDLVDSLEEDVGPIDERWRGIFEVLVPQVLGERGRGGVIGMALKLMIDQARRFVARNPEQARAQVILAARAVTAQLRIEPAELYPDLVREGDGAAAERR
jgi:hypothetical protein